ncbi:MAG: N-acetylmuramoyl-L-alanine amidase [Alphaproteobacteria bacterium]|nr:N-acetylmuramoyl-L-alanine amidase [Alphaproteobacteria bacterium]
MSKPTEFSKMKIGRRSLIKIAGGGLLAITFFPRIAFASRNSLESLRTGVQPGNRTRLVVETSNRPTYSLSYPTNPARLIVTLSNTAGRQSVKPALASNTLIKSLTQNQDGDRLQIVAALDRPINDIPKNQIMVLEPTGDTKFRLVLDFSASGASAGTAAAAASQPKQGGGTRRKPIIVVDAGHGGRDPGAIGRSGTREKDVVLAVARKLRTRLESSGFTVHLTRDRDVFLNLDTRAGIAEKRNADLFLSLHANANPSRNMRGFSIYTLSKKASDEEAQKLADAENAADKIDVDGFAGFEKNVKKILSDLQQSSLAALSVEFAIGAQKSFKSSGIAEQPRGSVRSAPFAVLRCAVPSALIELGHLSHREEEKLLASGAHQDKLVTAIVRAVNDYNFEV